MRKPAVVVTVAVSAVLTGGIMVATTAMAEEGPAEPAAPSLVLPEVPVAPRVPAAVSVPMMSGLPAVRRDPGVLTGRSAPAAEPARPGGAADAAGPTTAPGAATRAARPGGAAKSRSAPASAWRAARAEDRPVAKPAAERPARARANTLSAAQQDGTAGQALSTDPGGSVQQQALALVNESRRRGGCNNLTVDRRLVVAANKHAAEMARRGYFAHEDSRGKGAGDRVEDAGYRWKRFGENIARGQDSVAEVVRGWMNSPEHRKNIMDCALHEVGVGLAFSSDRTPYWVQNFATPQ